MLIHITDTGKPVVNSRVKPNSAEEADLAQANTAILDHGLFKEVEAIHSSAVSKPAHHAATQRAPSFSIRSLSSVRIDVIFLHEKFGRLNISSCAFFFARPCESNRINLPPAWRRPFRGSSVFSLPVGVRRLETAGHFTRESACT